MLEGKTRGSGRKEEEEGTHERTVRYRSEMANDEKKTGARMKASQLRPSATMRSRSRPGRRASMTWSGAREGRSAGGCAASSSATAAGCELGLVSASIGKRR